MSTPSSTSPENGAVQQTSPSAAAVDEDSMGDIPRRPMRVKVLYTFDDQNKSNCLARLPNVLSVPVVSLDETTQVGVMELKTCIQAIVGASPELVAKLGHDYTVYAYDFSEYETPLVGQGMLSWILASASATPNAPAEQSETMVTGRVCKNILGIFSNGVKETLEVKLKLVPVPTCMQKEYVENMERYHSLSQLMPDGFDYSAWSDFLKENPTLGQLAHPNPANPAYPAQLSQRLSFGGVEPFHQMLTRQSPSQDAFRNDSFYDPSNMSFNPQSTRASSPAMSTLSFQQYQYNPESRPDSRASVRSEAAPPPQQFPFSDPYVIEQQEEGPPKKRARITQAKRPKRTPLTAPNESLRVTASTAASVRLHKPALSNSAVTGDLVPRAPTPRPGDPFGQRGSRRPPAPSALRRGSMDEGTTYMSPYDTTGFSDNALDSADERDASPGDTPMDIPSSPPIAPQRTVSPAASSPPLPTLPLPTDSGFVSDMPIGHEEDSIGFDGKLWDGSDLPLAPEERVGPRQNKSRQPWQHINPGPVERLPQSYVPRPKQYHRKYPVQPITESIEQDTGHAPPTDMGAMNQDILDPAQLQQQQAKSHSRGIAQTNMSQYSNGRAAGRPARLARTDSFPFGPIQHDHFQEESQQGAPKAESPEETVSSVCPTGEGEAPAYSRSATPNLPPKQSKPSRVRGLPRSHTWSGAAEPMSDAPTPADSNNPRSGSGAKRKKYIKDKLEKAIAAGEMPPHCINCGEIDTPAWRKAYTRVEAGSPDDIELSTDTAGTGILVAEVIKSPDENNSEPKYRIFKNNLTREEKTMNTFESLNLCNPCGLWLIKKGEMRPQKQWDKSARVTKRKRNPGTSARSKSTCQGDDLVSDAIVPDSEPVMPDEQEEIRAFFDSTMEGVMPPPPVAREHTASFQATTSGAELDNDAAHAALRRAIQSSPAGLRGSKNSPIDIDPDLTPKPTRRLLFPSPRKEGEAKSLFCDTVASTATPDDVSNSVASREEMPGNPRCERCKGLKKACDRERPCGRCDNAGIGHDGCIPCPRKYWYEQPAVRIAVVDENSPDKENCPPPSVQEEEDFAHLFEEPVSPKTTPKKDQLFQDLLKTPTPGSRRRAPLTPRRSVDNADLLLTPSRSILTPRGTRAATIAPETPFTRQLNALLSDCPISSPSQAIDFSTFSAFNTPGRHGAQFTDFMHDDFLSSDMPMPSSPPKGGALGLGFDLYEDPNTSTVGLWSGANIFGSDTLLHDMESGSKHADMEFDDGPDATALLKMNVGGVTVDFAAMIEEVVSAANQGADMDVQPAPKSPEAQSSEVGKTPDEPAAE
ncbi:uncharacterized protein K460DRAFT_394150 [Cucurbitaria berberidis CBS 394.84]|uniref:Ams2/SPT21 N-terminal domain-containing protein n=1 Tax=Cucurbitaria berberidis CBS 394.84 TaxID=1168544 RepID=A0A9P4LB82_9PLEO|nr:uncharacterized protein K460DRAFT_394150 [Cucurbitaria berberidis CBS 394.84]KAF1849291.1 hypothetical protein K460DRAFT_394150 [Cucurbitaria berberidis CBS 394.84]